MQEDYSNPQELRLYEDSVNAYRDIVNAIKTAEKKKYAEGKAEGRTEGKIEVAQRLLDMGMPIDDIVMATGLTSEEISALKK